MLSRKYQLVTCRQLCPKSCHSYFSISSFPFLHLLKVILSSVKVTALALIFFLTSHSSTFALALSDVGTYSGSATIVDDGSGKYRLKFLTSGTFIPKNSSTIDVFLVGGGGGGGQNGGGGGYTTTTKNIAITAGTSYPIVVGEGGDGYLNGTSRNGGTSTGFGSSAAGGQYGNWTANGGSGGGQYNGVAGNPGGSNGGTGGGFSAGGSVGQGQGTTTREFGESTGDLYAGGGGGAESGAGGAGGGGCGWNPVKGYGCGSSYGVANTGGGGGGGNDGGTFYGVSGGSGIVIIRGTAILDSTPPSGGSITYSTGPITKSNQNFSLTVNDGTDAVGINTSSRQLLRSEAFLNHGTCGTFSSFSIVSYAGTYPNITTSNFHVDRCYKFSWSVADTSGNRATYTSSTIVKTSSNTVLLSKASIGTVVKINNISFVKVNSNGLLVSLYSYPLYSYSTFFYTGGVQTLTAPYTGTYQLEVWGAQGGSYSATCHGGYGGYATGYAKLTKDQVIYIYVGGAGLGDGSHTARSGGYNGGGVASSDGDGNTRQSSGGGATHMATSTGLLSTLSSNQSSILLVAGGGGTNGGSGGNYYESASVNGFGYGGSQTNGGSYTCTTGGGSYCIVGSFGTGASSMIAGGGGGYYGGGVGLYSGGGGSGYTGGVTNGSMTNSVQTGNGQAKITLISLN